MLSGDLDWVRPFLVKAAIELGLVDDKQRVVALREPSSRARRFAAALVSEGLLRGDEWIADAQLVVAAASVAAKGWGELARVVQTNTPLDEAAECVDPAYLTHLDLAAQAPALALALAASLTPPTINGAVVDLGGGLGTYGIALAKAFDRSCVLVDRAATIALLGERAAGVITCAADLLHDPLPTDAALALLCNVIHLYGKSDVERLIERAASVIAPGGHVVVRDLYVADDRLSPRRGVLFALNMALYSAAGDVYTIGEIATAMTAVGLRVRANVDGDFVTWIGQKSI